MAYCRECGANISDDAKFCKACGASTPVAFQTSSDAFSEAYETKMRSSATAIGTVPRTATVSDSDIEELPSESLRRQQLPHGVSNDIQKVAKTIISMTDAPSTPGEIVVGAWSEDSAGTMSKLSNAAVQKVLDIGTDLTRNAVDKLSASAQETVHSKSASHDESAHRPSQPVESISGGMSPSFDSSARACPHCGGEIASSAKFCRHCGQKLESEPSPMTAKESIVTSRLCPHCGGEVALSAKFCRSCGKAIS